MSVPAVLLRIEGGVLFALALLAYGLYGRNWILFAVLILAPDVSMVGFLRGNRLGAFLYDLGHTYALPGILAAIAMVGDNASVGSVAIIWFAHIGMDRLLGYGLKYPTHFKDTHLQRVV